MPQISTRTLLIGTFVAAAIATACGGDSGGGGGGGGATGGAPNKIDACTIVTQADATTLFAQPAEKDTGGPVGVGIIGECIWTHADAQNNSHLLQFSVWKGTEYYSPGANAQPFAIGDAGVIESSASLGVDVMWTQGDLVGALSYSTVGITPDATSKLEDVKTLALAADAKLPH